MSSTPLLLFCRLVVGACGVLAVVNVAQDFQQLPTFFSAANR